jgi:tetratricopeptide (TPR) repeat protein
MSVVPALVLILATATVASRAWRPPAPPVPTLADASAADPEVIALIRDRVQQVERAPFDAARRVELGLAYEANGQMVLARECYEQALARDPSQARWWYRLAMVRAQGGDLRGAIAAVDRAKAILPPYAPAFWRQGLWLLDEGDEAGAERAFRRAMEIDPSDPRGALGLARLELRRHRYAAAVQRTQQVIAEHPEHRYAHHLLGTAFRALGRADDARFALAVGATSQPEWPDPWNLVVIQYRRGYAALLREAEAHFASRQLDAATILLERLRQTHSEDVGVMSKLGAVYFESNRVDEAVRLLTKAVEREPARLEARINLALCYWKRKDFDRAVAQADAAIALTPGAGAAYRAKGLALRDAGRPDAAVDTFRTAVRVDPADLKPLVWIGRIERERKRPREALAAFDEVTDRDPTNVDALVGGALARLDLGDPTGALAHLQRAASLNNRHPDLPAAWARIWQLQDAVR